jgi:hypothetical protein
MLVGRLRFADEASENPGEGDGFLHGAARGGRGESLQMER